MSVHLDETDQFLLLPQPPIYKWSLAFRDKYNLMTTLSILLGSTYFNIYLKPVVSHTVTATAIVTVKHLLCTGLCTKCFP